MKRCRRLLMREAVEELVPNGQQVLVGGFAFDDPMAFAYELVRQERRDLDLLKTSGGLLVDLLLGAGCIGRLTFCHVWNSVGPVPTHAFRRALEDRVPHRPEFAELSLGAFTTALAAGAWGLPFMPTTPVLGAGHEAHRGHRPDGFGVVDSPFDDRGPVSVVKAIAPELGIFHVHRVDEFGNGQVFGATAELRQAIAACDRVLLVAEELVPTDVVRERPELTVVPGFMVEAIVVEPWSAHPTDAAGYYRRDLDFHEWYGRQTGSRDGFDAWVDDWIRGTADHAELVTRLRTEGAWSAEQLREEWWV